MPYDYRATLSDEDREIYDRMLAEKAANREHNEKVMADAGVPRPARRGFFAATDNHAYRIKSVEEYPTDRPRTASRWGVTTELYAGSHTTYGYIVGPRGRLKKVW